MKVLLVALVVVAASARTVHDEKRMFEDFKSTYGRVYAPEKESLRFECFRANLKSIDQRNAKGAEVHGVNQFTDLCPIEFNKMYLGMRPGNHTYKHKMAAAEASPKAGQAIDWRTKGAVTPIKNQGQCGSCWSFSATGNMEGQWQLAGNTLVGFSEEELVQCAHNGNEGCNGGLMDLAFEWVVTNGGIDTEADYPYTSGDGITGTCKTAKRSHKVGHLTGHQDVAKSEAAMATFVFEHGPLSIGVDAASGWQSYTGGVMKNCFGRQLDHGVLVVGFDEEASPPYWIVKNSWGTSWGENGYIRLEKGTDQCGLTMAPSSSIVKKA
jgi:cysteine peptidase B